MGFESLESALKGASFDKAKINSIACWEHIEPIHCSGTTIYVYTHMTDHMETQGPNIARADDFSD